MSIIERAVPASIAAVIDAFPATVAPIRYSIRALVTKDLLIDNLRASRADGHAGTSLLNRHCAYRWARRLAAKPSNRREGGDRVGER